MRTEEEERIRDDSKFPVWLPEVVTSGGVAVQDSGHFRDAIGHVEFEVHIGDLSRNWRKPEKIIMRLNNKFVISSHHHLVDSWGVGRGEIVW